MPDTPIGHIIRHARQKASMTQTALADAMGVSVSYINLIEHDRRRLKGARLKEVTDILGIDSGALDGEVGRRLLADLEEVTSDPAVADLALDMGQVRAFVTQHEPWAHALVALFRAGQRDQGVIAAFSDRLNHDPVLSESIHEMLNASTAIRSVTTIYDEGGDIPPEQRGRFDTILSEEAARLATVAQSLAGFFERTERPGSALTAPEEVDEFLFERRNHFPALEDAMEAERAAMAQQTIPSTAQLIKRLERLGVSSRRMPLHAMPPGAHRLTHFDGQTLTLAEGLPRSTERFEIARRIAELTAQDAVEAELEAGPDLTSDDARIRARRALFAYAAGALLMPYAAFHEAAETSRYDIDALAMDFSVSPEQLCHRFTSLRRPGSEGVPFAFLRANAAGYLTKRFPLPRLPMPRFGGACPLWAVYAAMQTPDLRHRQLAEFPNGDRFFILARATRPVAKGFGQTLPSYSLMLACDALNADRLIYSDGLDLSSAAPAEPVGPTCLLCPREGCAHRQEPSVRAR
jgi:predicted transcriptional regulator/transcriptional regulator with XRE-family HTH domain